MFPCHTVTRPMPHSKKVCKLVQKSEAKSSSKVFFMAKSTQILNSNSFKIKLFYYFFITWRSFSFVFSYLLCNALVTGTLVQLVQHCRVIFCGFFCPAILSGYFPIYRPLSHLWNPWPGFLSLHLNQNGSHPFRGFCFFKVVHLCVYQTDHSFPWIGAGLC